MHLVEPETSLPLVPPARLAALLIARRRQENVDRETIADRSIGLFDTRDIELLESGRAPLTNETVRAVTELYDLGAGPVVPGRSRLIVDLDMGKIETDGHLSHLPRAETPMVLERYLALVYVMRGIEPGTEIQLRRNDIEVLAGALGIDDEEISNRLRSLMTSPAINRRTRRLSRKLSVPGVGLLVGFTTLGALILAPAAAAEEIAPSEASVQVSESVEIMSPVNELQLSMPTSEYQSPELERINAASVSFDNSEDLSERSENTEVDEAPATAEAESVDQAETDVRLDDAPASAQDSDSVNQSANQPADQPANQSADQVADQPASAPEVTSQVAEPEIDQTPVQPAPATPPVQAQPTTTQPAPTIEEQKPAEQVVPAAAASQSPTEIGRQAEALISYDYQQKLPGWTVSYEGNRPGYRGMTNRIDKTVIVYVRDGDTPSQVAEILAHELGHALDLELMSNEQRLEWLEARGMPQVWWVDNAHSDFEAGQGDFAEAVAALWVGSPSHSHHGGFTPEQLALAASFIQ